MKRKAIPVFISLVLAAALLLGMTPDAMAATSRCDIIGHSWSGWKTTKSPTCTAQGSEERTCSRCGKKETRSIAAKGHSFKYLRTEQEATCTEDGIALFTCPQCSAKENRTIKAKGHEWDEGVITQPEGLLEGAVKTYTCLKCGETRTEEIPPETPKDGSSIMNALRGLPPGFSTMNLDLPLKIEKQPVGGFINHNGGSLTLSVEAAGGEPPYSYQWRRAYYSTWLPAINEWWDDVEGGTESTLEADRGKCRYYCRVTDSKGNRVKSDKVLVSWDLYIAEQPKNANLYGKESVTLSCRAAGGDPFRGGYGDGYSYGWIGPDGSVMNNPNTNEAGNELTVSEPGTYYCWVMDNGTREVYSDTALVYNAEPLQFTQATEDIRIIPDWGEKAEIAAEFKGGISPYTCQWRLDGEPLGDPVITEQLFAGLPVSELGEYNLTVTDDTGEFISRDFPVRYRQLKIVKQPEGGILSFENKFSLEVVVAAQNPVKYTLYRDGEVYSTHKDDPYFTVTDAGQYYFHIEDANGQWADSDTVTVEHHTLRITDVPVTWTGSVNSTLRIAVEGGTAPYSAKVTVKDHDGYNVTTDSGKFYEKESERSFEITGYVDTVALVEVRDANHLSAVKEVYIPYPSTLPLITKQPGSYTAPYNDGGNYTYELNCEAIAGQDSELQYTWYEKRFAGDWKRCGSGKTYYLINRNCFAKKYYCEVTNLKTGQSVNSKTADVLIELKWIRAEQVGTSNVIEFEAAGGDIAFRNMAEEADAHVYPVPEATTPYGWWRDRIEVTQSGDHLIIRLTKVDKTIKWMGKESVPGYAAEIYCADTGGTWVESPVVYCTK